MLPSAQEPCWQEEGMTFEKWACCILGRPNTKGWMVRGRCDRGGHWATEITKLVSCLSESDTNPNQTQPRRNTHINMSHAPLPQWPLAMTVMQYCSVQHCCSCRVFHTCLMQVLCLYDSAIDENCVTATKGRVVYVVELNNLIADMILLQPYMCNDYSK